MIGYSPYFLCVFSFPLLIYAECSRKRCLVEHRGFEPLTSTLPVLRAPNCANAPLPDYYSIPCNACQSIIRKIPIPTPGRPCRPPHPGSGNTLFRTGGTELFYFLLLCQTGDCSSFPSVKTCIDFNPCQ